MAHTCLNFYITPILEKPEDFKKHVETYVKECTKSLQLPIAQEKEFLCYVNLIETGVLMKDIDFLRKVCAFIVNAAKANILKNVVERVALHLERNKQFLPLIGLIQYRAKMLEKELGDENKFSWKMTNASLPEYPHVETFLRGEESRMDFENFTTIQTARQFVTKYTGLQKGFSTFMYANGSGKKSYVSITKTEDIFELTEKGRFMVELKKLREILSFKQEEPTPVKNPRPKA